MYVRSTEKEEEYRIYFDKKTGKRLNLEGIYVCEAVHLYTRV